jgi:(1->4)-alpha-D-glucan 1-alpha-D-glucosylmutase
VPRLVLGIDDWQDTTVRLPDGEWHDQLGERVHRGGDAPVADLLGDFPVALLAPSRFVEGAGG